MSGPRASLDCALSRPASSEAPAATPEEAFKNARRETPCGIMLRKYCMVAWMIAAVSNRVETNGFHSGQSALAGTPLLRCLRECHAREAMASGRGYVHLREAASSRTVA